MILRLCTVCLALMLCGCSAIDQWPEKRDLQKAYEKECPDCEIEVKVEYVVEFKDDNFFSRTHDSGPVEYAETLGTTPNGDLQSWGVSFHPLMDNVNKFYKNISVDFSDEDGDGYMEQFALFFDSSSESGGSNIFLLHDKDLDGYPDMSQFIHNGGVGEERLVNINTDLDLNGVIDYILVDRKPFVRIGDDWRGVEEINDFWRESVSTVTLKGSGESYHFENGEWILNTEKETKE